MASISSSKLGVNLSMSRFREQLRQINRGLQVDAQEWLRLVEYKADTLTGHAGRQALPPIRSRVRCFSCAGWSLDICGAKRERESKFSAGQIGIWERGTKVCPTVAFTQLVSRLQASRFTAGLTRCGMAKTSPFLTGLSSGFSHDGK
jgi:hypothetical protein